MLRRLRNCPLLILLLLTLSLRAAAAEQQANSELRGALNAIDAWIAGTQHYDRIPGISVGVVHDQTLIFERGYGRSNMASGRAADSDTLYSICSISKLFTAIGIMQLRDAGKLTLRDTVGSHLDWFDIDQAHAGSAPIRIEGLLTHSSGLPRESDFPYWTGPGFPFPTREEMIARLDDQETLYPAERLFQYSNLALTLAGEIVSSASGQAYENYVEEQILTPLGLVDTRTFYPEELRGEQLAIGYSGIHRDLQREPVAAFFTRGITAAAGFTSSVKDLARFASWQFRLRAQGGEEVLDANTLREMQRVHWVDPDWGTSWGLGFAVRRDGDYTVVSHGGGCPGYITSFATVPDKQVAAIVLTNAGDGPASRLSRGILKTVIPALQAEEEADEGELPDFSAYEGNYESRPWGGEVAIRQWGEQLAVINLPTRELDPDAVTHLRHEAGHRFVRLSESREPRESWTFEVDERGRAARIKRHGTYLTRIINQ